MPRMVHSRFTPWRRWWSATNWKRFTSASPRRNTPPPSAGSRVPPPVRDFLRRASFSASSGVGGSADACVRRPRGRLAPAAGTQFRNVSGLTPRSAATDLIVASGRDSYNATASALNCGG